jgi:hypothetical protein
VVAVAVAAAATSVPPTTRLPFIPVIVVNLRYSKVGQDDDKKNSTAKRQFCGSEAHAEL